MDLFIVAVGFIFLHELDAMRCHEWRILPLTFFLKDKLGMQVFVWAHLPLFYWIIIELQTQNELFRYGFNWFLIAHLVAHILYLKHPKNEFKDVLSWSIIIGAALCAALDLLNWVNL